MDLFILLAFSGIIFLLLVWILEGPAFLIRIYRNLNSWEEISGSTILYLLSPLYIVVIGGTLAIIAGLMAILVVVLIISIPFLIVLLPILFLIYRWYQLGDMMLDFSDVLHRGMRNRME